MPIADCYRSDSLKAAFSLRWSWSGWPSECLFPELSEHDWHKLSELWEQDGIRLLERKCTSDQWQVTVSTKPNVIPTQIVARLKGRIDHLCRSKGIPFKFSRKVSLRTLGNNTITDVRDYIRSQVVAAQFCDPDFATSLKQFTRIWNGEHAGQVPIEVASGRYWYHLHLVLVVDDRHRIRDLSYLGAIFESCQAIALDRGFMLDSISVLPDHVHLSLRGAIADSPEAIAMAYLNDSCRMLRANELWRPSYYVGSIGAYNMNAVRS